MYGMVNKGMQAYVETQYGPTGWDRLWNAVGKEPVAFVSLKTYDDSVSYTLVGGVEQAFGVSAGEFLRGLGRFWVGWVRTQGYDNLLRMAGSDTLGVLRNLDGLHARIHLSFPDLKPPSFHLEEAAEGTRLHYRSDRPGLASFVVGLVEGVADMFSETADIQLLADAEEDHDVFRIRVSVASVEP